MANEIIKQIKIGSVNYDIAGIKLIAEDQGSATQPVYFENGIPVACTYSLNKTVPSNAVFTDTDTKVKQSKVITNLFRHYLLFTPDINNDPDGDATTTEYITSIYIDLEGETKIVAPKFQGQLQGTASNNLPLSGGTLTGALYLNNNSNHRPAVLIKENNYWGLKDPSGGNDWIRTTTQGIIPNQAGNAGAGHCSLGTNTWYFSAAYIDNVYGYLNGNISGNAATATTATKLGTNAGSSTVPVYFTGGKPSACSRTIPVVYTAAECTSYTSDTGTCTPAAVKKAVGMFDPKAHTHDDRYFTESEINTILGNYLTSKGITSSTSHNIDSTGGIWTWDVANSWGGSAPRSNGWVNITQTTGGHFYGQIAMGAHSSGGGMPNGFWYRTKYNGKSFSNWMRIDTRCYHEGNESASNYVYLSNSHGWSPFVSGINLGSSSKRWGTIYPSSGSITSSDLKLKYDLIKLSDDDRYIQLFDLLEPYAYKFINGNQGRVHTGFISQDAEKHLQSVGLTAKECAFFCKDKKIKEIYNEYQELVEVQDVYDKNGNLEYDYSLRYEEYIAIIAAKIKSLEKEYNQKFESQEKRISELENLVLKLIEDR